MNDYYSKLIKCLRDMTGLSRKEFCQKYDIPYQTVTDWELGHRTPPDYLIKYMTHYVIFFEFGVSLPQESATYIFDKSKLGQPATIEEIKEIIRRELDKEKM